MFVNQSIQRPQGINVFGSHLIRTEPDYASLRFSVAATAERPADSLAEASAAVDRVHEVLREAEVAEADVQSSRVTLELAFEGYADERRAVGYQATRSFQVFARDLSGIEPLLIALVDAGAGLIHSVSYKTSELLRLRAQAREGAVRAARGKAEAYASAAGVKVGRAIHIEDVNPDEMSRRSHAPDVSLGGHSDGAAGAGSIVIAGAVMVCFSILES